MKGFEELTKAYIYLAITLIIVSFAVNPLFASIQSATKNNARLNAIEIASVINTMKASSGDLKYTIDLPRECKIDITNGFVKVEIEKSGYAVELIQTTVAVSPNLGVDCEQQGSITIQKSGQVIVVS